MNGAQDRPVQVSGRVGSWMQTYTGGAFWPLDPRPEDIDIFDVAHALSQLCRYGGHTGRFYSVAEHCVLMSHAVSPQNALAALLHDATEAYLVDMPRPIKRHLPTYQEIEANLWLAFATRFGLPDELPAEVIDADNRILQDERAVLMAPAPLDWGIDHLEPLGVHVQAWDSHRAEHEYLARLDALYCDVAA